MESAQIFQTFASQYPQVVYTGAGALKQLKTEVESLRAKRVMVVADAGIVDSGIAGQATDQLKGCDVEVTVFSDVAPNPTLKSVNACGAAVRENKIDLVIGIGGGSCLDTAKTGAVLGVNPGDFRAYLGMQNIPLRGLPKILIPTTHGTGSEAGQGVILKDEETEIKNVAYSRFLQADSVILDPLLTLSMPRQVTVDSGCDTLVAAIEHYISLRANHTTDLLALEAIRLVGRSFRTVYCNGKDVEGRYQMLLASFLSGIAQGSGLGGIHGLSYPLESLYHLAHGRANAVMAPAVLAFNRMASIPKFRNIAVALGENVDGLSPQEASHKAVRAVKDLLADLNVSTRLRDYNVTKESIPEMAKTATETGVRLFEVNPRRLTPDDAIVIYEQAW